MSHFFAGAAAYLWLAWLAWTWPGCRACGPDPAPARLGARVRLPGGEVLAEPGQRSRGGASGGAFQRIEPGPDSYRVRYGFVNFDRSELSIEAELPRREVEASVREFGFRKEDLAALDGWHGVARESAIRAAKAGFVSGRLTAPTQAELDAKLAQAKRRNEAVQAGLERTLEGLAEEYRRRRLKLYADAGFRLVEKNTLAADMPALVRRNSGRMAPVSTAFEEISRERDYGMEELVGAVTAMAQTALRYQLPAREVQGRTIGGVLPPPKSFVLGMGDCDTKTALMGSVLSNWPNLRLVGLAIPEHYLLAVHRIPARGEVYVEYDGLPYVMIEPAGPAWIPPGGVGDFTERYLGSGKLFNIEPFNL